MLASTSLPSVFSFELYRGARSSFDVIFGFVFVSFCFSLALVGLSFSGAIGLTFLLLGCALEQYGYESLFTPKPELFFLNKLSSAIAT